MAKKDRHENLGWGDRDQPTKQIFKPDVPPQPSLFARLFCIPHILIGFWLLYMSVLNVMPVVFGTDVQGNVEELSAHEIKKRTSYKVVFRFPDGDTFIRSDAKVDRSFYSTLKEGSPVPVRYWFLAKQATAYITYPDYNHINGFLLFFTCFWDSIMGIIFFAFYVRPLLVVMGIVRPVSAY